MNENDLTETLFSPGAATVDAAKDTAPGNSTAERSAACDTAVCNTAENTAASAAGNFAASAADNTAAKSRAQDTVSSLSHGLEDRSILLDNRLETLGIGREARLAIGSVSKAGAIGEFLSGPDAFRLEEFARRTRGYEALSTLELTLSGVPGYSYACACRRDIFGSDAILITLYKSKRDFLLAYEGMSAYNFLPLSEKDLLPKLETARRMIAVFARSHAEEAAVLSSTLNELVGHTLAGSVICSILMQGDGSYSPYGLAEIVQRAAEHVKRSLSGADISFSSRTNAECDGALACSVPAEHMWFLATCVLTTAVKLSGHGRTVIEILTRDGRICMRTASPSSPFTSRLPEHMTLSELKNVVPASSLRLFLCELICEEYQAACDVHCGSDMFEITFEFKPRHAGRSFHRFDPVYPFAEWEYIANEVIIPDSETPDTRQGD